MFVCVCFAVTDKQVDAAIQGGAHSREAVTAACKAGGDCGSCHDAICDKIEEHQEKLVGTGGLVRVRAA